MPLVGRGNSYADPRPADAFERLRIVPKPERFAGIGITRGAIARAMPRSRQDIFVQGIQNLMHL